MKRLKFIWIFFVAVWTVQAQTGKVLESLEMKSMLLDYPVKYSVYLPSDYEASTRSYPVLYLLHGFTDNETGWIQFGEANRIADRLINSGEISSMIIVMPDGKETWYCDDYQMKDPWESMFIDEFIPYIENTYRIRKKKEFRAISGLSMGGRGSLILSMKYSDLFSTCVAFSASVLSDEQVKTMDDSRYRRFFGNRFGHELRGEDRLSENWKLHNSLYLLDRIPLEKLKSVRYYLDCGDDDGLTEGNSALHLKMRRLGIYHEFRVRQGSHSWPYWREGLSEGLKFISENFHR